MTEERSTAIPSAEFKAIKVEAEMNNFEYVLMCSASDEKIKKLINKIKNKKRKRVKVAELTQQEKDVAFVQCYQRHVINEDITFTKRVLPFLFGAIDFKNPLCARKMR